MGKAQKGTIVIEAGLGQAAHQLNVTHRKAKPPGNQPEVAVIIDQTQCTSRADVLKILTVIHRHIADSDDWPIGPHSKATRVAKGRSIRKAEAREAAKARAEAEAETESANG